MPEWFDALVTDIGDFFSTLGQSILDGFQDIVEEITNLFPWTEEGMKYLAKAPEFVSQAYRLVDALPPFLTVFMTLSIVGSLAFLLFGRGRVD